MGTRLGTVNTPSLISTGLAATLGPDYTVEKVNDPQAWLKDNAGGAVLLVAVNSGDDLELVNGLTADLKGGVVVALLDPITEERMIESICAGAAGCLSTEWSRTELVTGLTAALSGMTVLPRSLARRALPKIRPRFWWAPISDIHLSWLNQLAAGSTVASLADRVGYSEREMYRRLKGIYRTMGAGSRTEALILASQWGLLDTATAAR